MYTFEKQTIGNTSAIKLINTQTQEYAQIALDFAGNLTQLVLLSPQNTLVSVIDGYQTEAELVEHKGYKSTKLVPFPNQLDYVKYSINKHE